MLSLSLSGQFGPPVNDPVEDIPKGELSIELEEWVTIPASNSGTPKAKLSVFRTTPDGRFWVNDQRGKLWQIIDDNPVQYFDIKNLKSKFIDSPGLGTGFHSFAFHPDFLSNGKFYTTHSEGADAEVPDFTGKAANKKGQQGVITEWTVSDPTARSFSGSSRELMRIQFPGNIHCLQEINFRPQAEVADEDYGLLYICVGDGGSYNEGFPDNTHRLDSPFGAVLRIDPMGTNSANGRYGNPDSNPWADDGDPDTLGELYAYGFRNPHRLTWDRGGDGIGLLGGIGEKNIEEVNLLVPGADYGWPVREGTFVIDPNSLPNRDIIYDLPANDADFGYTYPVAQYDHDDGFAIIGGYVYRGAEIPALAGKYVLGDIKNGRVFYLEAADLEIGKQTQMYTMTLTRNGVETTLPAIIGRDRADLRFGEGGDGELFIMTKTDGKIRKVAFSDGPSGGLDPNPDDFEKVANFESEGEPVSSKDGEVSVVNDPYSGSKNKVLAIHPDSTAHAVEFLDGVPINGTGTVYFRFALSEGTSLATLGFSEETFAEGDFAQSGLFKVKDEGSLYGRDRLSLKKSEMTLLEGQWYEAWLIVKSEDVNYELHILGADRTAPSLVSGPLSMLSLTPKAINSLSISSGTDSMGILYLDDIHIDNRDMNFSSPVEVDGWRLISNLENPELLSDWSIWGTGGTPEGSLATEGEFNGNTIGQAAFGLGGNASTFINDFPLEIDVGGNTTLYARVLPAFSMSGERIGFRSAGSEQKLADDIDANLEGYVRFQTMPVSGERRVQIRDAVNEVPATMPDGSPIIFSEDHGWIDVWLVLRNGGRASGGQTYDVFLRSSDLGPDPLMVADNVEFRQGQEVPLLSAVVHSSSEGQTLSIDDVYLALGEQSSRPLNLGDEIFPNPPGEKEIPWFGLIDDSAEPWVLHETHGWLYFEEPDSATAAWAYDAAMDWIYMDSVSYPSLYSYVEDSWLYYYIGTQNPRWFYHYNTDQWIED